MQNIKKESFCALTGTVETGIFLGFIIWSSRPKLTRPESTRPKQRSSRPKLKSGSILIFTECIRKSNYVDPIMRLLKPLFWIYTGCSLSIESTDQRLTKQMHNQFGISHNFSSNKVPHVSNLVRIDL